VPVFPTLARIINAKNAVFFYESGSVFAALPPECAEASGCELFCSDFRADKGETPKNRNPNPGSAASLGKLVGRKEILAWRRSPNFAKWRTTSTRGREHRVIRLQSKSSGRWPTTILKRPSDCGTAKISKSDFYLPYQLSVEIRESNFAARSLTCSGRQASSAICSMRGRSNLRASRSLEAARASQLAR
jgi:hypothetical protein